MNDLDKRVPTHVSLVGSQSVADMAASEKWTPDSYAVALASNVRNCGVDLQAQTERLQALAGMGGALSLQADQTAAALAQHYAILEALFQRFTHESLRALNNGGPKAPEIANGYLGASIKAQRACLAVLSALRVIRGGAASAPTTPATTGGLATLTFDSN